LQKYEKQKTSSCLLILCLALAKENENLTINAFEKKLKR
jgi:hypothetical protein